jgi:hypothetical protein
MKVIKFDENGPQDVGEFSLNLLDEVLSGFGPENRFTSMQMRITGKDGKQLVMRVQPDCTGHESAMLTIFVLTLVLNPGPPFSAASIYEWLERRQLLRHFKPT